jgi:phytoene dehydrogenase-like protein
MTYDYHAVVIGSGLGGLTAGALYARAGYRALVLEKNDAFGGAATVYYRDGLTVEASLHETTDPRRTADPKGEIFEALDLYDELEFVPVDAVYEVRSALIGEPIALPAGAEALCRRLSERFPRDADALSRFFRHLEGIEAAMAMVMERHDGRWWLLHAAELPFRLWPVLKDLQSSLSEVLTRYFGDNDALKVALAANLGYYDDDPDRMWWLAYAAAQGGFFHGGGYYLKGGSQALSDCLVARIREAGGDVWGDCRVDEVLLDANGGAAGVRYRVRADEEESSAAPARTVRAPVVFANAAPHAIAPMLPPEAREAFMAPHRDRPLSISLFSITLGLRQAPANFGVSAYSTVLVPDWIGSLGGFRECAALLGRAPDGRLPVLTVVDRSRIDSGLVSAGDLYPVSVVGVDDIDNWTGLDRHAYAARKSAWLDAIVGRLDEEWPGFGASVAVREMSTAQSMHEHLGTPRGAVYGFAPHVPANPLSPAGHSGETSVPGLYLASAFGGFGGFSGAMGAGAVAVRTALRDGRQIGR